MRGLPCQAREVSVEEFDEEHLYLRMDVSCEEIVTWLFTLYTYEQYYHCGASYHHYYSHLNERYHLNFTELVDL